jgi:hypothetical protein
MPEAVRGKMEAALGADFSNVRVHVGPQAERIGAIAFTLGSDIYFAPGRYQPDTAHGPQLLGHELAHVVQQRTGRVKNPLGSGLAVVQDRALEAEADRLGRQAAVHRPPAQAKMLPGAAPPAPPVRISPPISAGPGSYRLTAGAGGRQVGSVMLTRVTTPPAARTASRLQAKAPGVVAPPPTRFGAAPAGRTASTLQRKAPGAAARSGVALAHQTALGLRSVIQQA